VTANPEASGLIHSYGDLTRCGAPELLAALAAAEAISTPLWVATIHPNATTLRFKQPGQTFSVGVARENP
jgi:hypothetical protein